MHIQNDAIHLLRKAARINADPVASAAGGSTFGDARSFGLASQMHTQTKLKSIIKLKNNVNRENPDRKTSMNLNLPIAGSGLAASFISKGIKDANASFGIASPDHASSIPRTADSPTRLAK